MPIDTIEDFMKGVAKELQKHAARDDCYACKQLLQYPPLMRFINRNNPLPDKITRPCKSCKGAMEQVRVTRITRKFVCKSCGYKLVESIGADDNESP